MPSERKVWRLSNLRGVSKGKSSIIPKFPISLNVRSLIYWSSGKDLWLKASEPSIVRREIKAFLIAELNGWGRESVANFFDGFWNQISHGDSNI